MAIILSGVGYSVTPSPLAISEGGTGQSSATAAINALVPAQTGNSGKVLTTDGTSVSWQTGGGGGGGSGSVTSVAVSVPAFLSVSGSPVTTAGTIAIGLSGTALPIANGGTGATSAGAALTALGAVSLSVQNTYTKSQVVTPATLTSASTVTVDASLSNNFRLVLATNATLANPTNLVNGQVFNIMIVQDAFGSRTLAYGTKFKFVGGATPVLSTGSSAVDILGCYYDGVNDMIYANLNKAYA